MRYQFMRSMFVAHTHTSHCLQAEVVATVEEEAVMAVAEEASAATAWAPSVQVLARSIGKRLT